MRIKGRDVSLVRAPYELAAGVGRVLLRGARRAGKISSLVSIAGTKTLIDAVFHRDQAKTSFDQLSDNRYHPYLLIALTQVGPVGCPPHDVAWAYKWMPVREFFSAIRINRREPAVGTVISETRQGPNILSINRHYYSLPPAEYRFF